MGGEPAKVKLTSHVSRKFRGGLDSGEINLVLEEVSKPVHNTSLFIELYGVCVITWERTLVHFRVCVMCVRKRPRSHFAHTQTHTHNCLHLDSRPT